MAKKNNSTFAKAQAALSRAIRDFEKSVSGLVSGEKSTKAKKRKKANKRKAKRKA